MPRERMLEHFYRALDRLAPLAREAGTRLLVENMPFAFLPDAESLWLLGRAWTGKARHAPAPTPARDTPLFREGTPPARRCFKAPRARVERPTASGQRPAISGDSYLHVGDYLKDLSTVYDWMYDRLTQAQRDRWAAYAEQAVWNVWHPSQAQWGGKAFPWSGWSTNNPGNNYYYSFVEANRKLRKRHPEIVADVVQQLRELGAAVTVEEKTDLLFLNVDGTRDVGNAALADCCLAGQPGHIFDMRGAHDPCIVDRHIHKHPVEGDILLPKGVGEIAQLRAGQR